jgi:hypothetical protein
LVDRDSPTYQPISLRRRRNICVFFKVQDLL